MPSLSALNEFRDSFSNISNEKDDVISQDIPFDNLALPTTEAPPYEPPSRNAPPPSDDDFSETSSGVGNLDFSALLGSVPEDPAPPPSIDDILKDVIPPSDESPPSIEPQSDMVEMGEDSPLESQSDLAAPEQSGEDFSLNDIIPPPDDVSSVGDTPDDTSSIDETLPVDDTRDTPVDSFAGAAEKEDDFSVPDGLLTGLSDEIEATPPDSGIEDIGDLNPAGEDLGGENSGSEGLGDQSFGGEDTENSQGTEGLDFENDNFDSSRDLGDGLPDLDFPDTEHVADTESDSSDDLDLGGERQDGTLSTENVSDDSPVPEDMPAPEDTPLPDFDLNGEGIDMGGESPAPGGGDFNLDEAFSGADFPEAEASSDFDSQLPDMDFPEGEAPEQAGSDSDTGEMDSSPDSGAEDSGAGDSGGLPELEDIGGDFSSGSIDLNNDLPDESAAPAGSDSGGDDFALPGLEEIFDKSKIETIAPPAPKKGFFKGKKAEVKEEPEAEDVEEIRLSQEDLDKLLKTLSDYPLNLRVACEEMIAEMVLLPQQLSKLIRLLVDGAYAKETAEFAREILGKEIVIPKSFEKSTGAALEEEKASFAYIFVHNFLPVLRLFAVIAALVLSIIYLGYKFIYIPLKAESIYKRGYERIFAGEYQRANELFHEAFTTHRKKQWFYKYSEGFRDQRRYMLAEAKYDELLRYYPRDKKGVLDYASLETNYLMNYDKANRILQQQLLDYAPNDYEGLLAAGDNFLDWADSNPSRFYDRYEDARFSYARLLENYGWQAPIVERMMKYFIHTDNLKETLYLRNWFDNDDKRQLSPESIAELGGYLLDKQLASASGEIKGVPDPYIESIESVRAMLLQAVRKKPELPEPHYHLARYYKNLGNVYEERLTLENAIRAYDLAEKETVRRRLNRVDTHYRYANLLINNREFFPAEEQLVRGIELYEDFLSRNLVSPSPQLGQLYAAKGDLEYFVKTGNMQAALNDYKQAEKYGWSPPEIQYRMGAAYYQLENWGNALEYLFKASSELPLNRRLLYALGNTAYKRGDYYASQGYYSRLLDILENQRARLPVLLPNDRPEFLELGERLMMARNNAGVVNEALADVTGNRDYRSRALTLYAESARAWDSITRNPTTMTRMQLSDMPGAPGVNLGFLNAGNALRPVSGFKPEIFIRIDKDVLEPSRWEELAPFGGLIN